MRVQSHRARRSHVGIEGEGAVIGGERFLRPPELHQRVAAVVMGARIPRLLREAALVARERLVQARESRLGTASAR